jgi:hypothetical protein
MVFLVANIQFVPHANSQSTTFQRKEAQVSLELDVTDIETLDDSLYSSLRLDSQFTHDEDDEEIKKTNQEKYDKKEKERKIRRLLASLISIILV